MTAFYLSPTQNPCLYSEALYRMALKLACHSVCLLPSRLHRSHSLLDSTVFSLHHCWFHLVGVCGCSATPPRPPTLAARLCVHLRQQGSSLSTPLLPPTTSAAAAVASPAAPDMGVSGGGTIPPLPPTQTSVARLCNLRPLGFGLARADGCPLPSCAATFILHNYNGETQYCSFFC